MIRLRQEASPDAAKEQRKLIERIAALKLVSDYFPLHPDQVVEGNAEWHFTPEDVKAARELIAGG